ncbi:hypothetical protein BJF79_08055 [Actinomadura sp. CNU-125]|nr:hypothetical protein BJF79_08055 [Actinomadura sp. CNU-125]
MKHSMRAGLTLAGGLLFATAGGLAYDALTAAPAHAAVPGTEPWQRCPPYSTDYNRLDCDPNDTGTTVPGFDPTDIRRQVQEMRERFGGQYAQPRRPAPEARPETPKQRPESRRTEPRRRSEPRPSAERPDESTPDQPPIVPPDRVVRPPTDRRPAPDPKPNPTAPKPNPAPPSRTGPGAPSSPGTGQAPPSGPGAPANPGGPGNPPGQVPNTPGTPQPTRPSRPDVPQPGTNPPPSGPPGGPATPEDEGDGRARRLGPVWNPGVWARYLNTRFQMWLSSSQAPTEPGYVWKKTAEKTLERSWDKNQKSGWNTFPDPQWYTAPGYAKLAAELSYAAWQAWLETPGGNRNEVKKIAQRVEELRGKLDEARARGDAAAAAKLERLLAKAELRLAQAKEIETGLWPGLEELENGNGQEGQQGQGEDGGEAGTEGQGGEAGTEGQGGEAGSEGQGGQSAPNQIEAGRTIEPPNSPVAPQPEVPQSEGSQRDLPRPEVPQRDLPRPDVPGGEEPVDPPAQPDGPGGPATPGHPFPVPLPEPVTPEGPEQPETPNLPGDPTAPETPRTPEGPGLPADPEPNLPGEPEGPEGPGLPGDPEQPDAPVLPGDPEAPESPGTPEGPGEEPSDDAEDDPFRVPPAFPAVRPGPTVPGTPTPREQPRVRPVPGRPSGPDLPGRVLERPRTPAPAGQSRPSGGRSEPSRPSDTRPGTGRPSGTRPGGGGRRPRPRPAPSPVPATGGPVRTLPAPVPSRPPLGTPKPGPAPEWDETGPIVKREPPMPDRPPQQPVKPKVETPKFTPDKVPGVTGKSPLRGRNIAAEVATLGLEELYGRALSQNLNWAAQKIAEDPEFARQFAEEYDRFQELSWVERRKRDFGQFLGFNSERFIEDYFVPELRDLAEEVLNPPLPQQTTPPAPDDGRTRFGVMTPQDWANTHTTDALYRYKVGEEGQNLDLLLRDEPRRAPASAPAPAEEPDREEEEKEDDDGPSGHEKRMEMIEEGREYRRQKEAEENSGNERPDNHDGGHGLSDGGGDAPAPSAPAPAPSAPPSGGSSNTIDGGGSGGAPPQGGGPAPAPTAPSSPGNADSDPAHSMNKLDDPSIKA